VQLFSLISACIRIQLSPSLVSNNGFNSADLTGWSSLKDCLTGRRTLQSCQR